MSLVENWDMPIAELLWQHRRDGKLVEEGWARNLITNSGRVFMHTQTYGKTPGANGLNYVALSSATSITEIATDNTLASEISAVSGLNRVQATTVTLPVGAGTSTTIQHVFTMGAAGPQTVGKCALFSAAAAGTMCHVLLVSPSVSMVLNDTLTLTFTIGTP